MDSIRKLGEAIKEARIKRGLTQDDLSDRAGLAYSTLAKIEQGAIKNPSVFTVHALAESMDMTVEDLLVSVKPVTRAAGGDKGIKFLYCDVNGVLLRFYQHAFVTLAQELGVPVGKIETTFWHYNDPTNRGEMTLDEFNKAMAQHLGVEKVNWKRHYMGAVEPVTEMHELLASAKAKIKIGLLTNSMPGFVKEMFDKGLLPAIDFDVIVDSSELGTVKPEPRIYEIAQQQADVKPESILLVDDSRENLTEAQRLGWRTFWFDDYNPPESVGKVERLLNL